MKDLGYGRGWAADDAAASIFRIDQQLGHPAQITEAGRSREDADRNRAAWLAYQNGTGPKAPYALGADESVHCTGEAVDTNAYQDAHENAVWNENGWIQTARYPDDRDEPWHREYARSRDQHLNDPTPRKDDDMLVRLPGKSGRRNGGTWLLANGKATQLNTDVTLNPTIPLINAEAEIQALAKLYAGLPA